MYGPTMIISCAGSDTWVPITPDFGYRMQGGSDFVPFLGYPSAPSAFECTFALPLDTPLYDSALIGYAVQFVNRMLVEY